MDKSILRNIAGFYQNRNSPQTCGDKLTYKNFKKLSQVEALFNITQNYSLLPRALQNCAVDDFMRVI